MSSCVYLDRKKDLNQSLNPVAFSYFQSKRVEYLIALLAASLSLLFPMPKKMLRVE